MEQRGCFRSAGQREPLVLVDSSKAVRMLRYLAIGVFVLVVTSACTQEPPSESPASTAAVAPQTEPSKTSTTVQVEIPDSGTSTLVGIVTSIGSSEQGGDSWTYNLMSGEALDVPKGLSQGCSYWGSPPISLGEEHPECAIAAIVEPGDRATLVQDLHIPTGEDADLWQEVTGDHFIGLLRISDLTGDRTEVVTDEGFALEVAPDADGYVTQLRSTHQTELSSPSI